jgi:hypothetical protein
VRFAPDEDGSRSVAYGEPTPGTEPITGDCSVPAAVPTRRTELPDLVEVVAVSRQWRRSFAFPLSIPGLHQDHLPALAGRF